LNEVFASRAADRVGPFFNDLFADDASVRTLSLHCSQRSLLSSFRIVGVVSNVDQVFHPDDIVEVFNLRWLDLQRVAAFEHPQVGVRTSAACQRGAERHDSQNTHLLVPPAKGIVSQLMREIN
jgi:hypothetical protein